MDVSSAFNITELVDAELVIPLDPYLQRSGFDVKPFGPTLDNLRIGGRLYDLPTRSHRCYHQQ